MESVKPRVNLDADVSDGLWQPCMVTWNVGCERGAGCSSLWKFIEPWPGEKTYLRIVSTHVYLESNMTSVYHTTRILMLKMNAK